MALIYEKILKFTKFDGKRLCDLDKRITGFLKYFLYNQIE